MNTNTILQEIDSQILKLQQARELLVPTSPTAPTKRKYRKRQNGMSPEARARISDAMKKRWAKASKPGPKSRVTQ